MVPVVLEFLGEATDERWPGVQRTLEAAGAQSIGLPPTRSPLLVRALIPDDADVDALLARLRALDGVGRVDVDAPRGTYGPE